MTEFHPSSRSPRSRTSSFNEGLGHKDKRKRGGSISGRLRTASDLEEHGWIDKTQKGILKDMIISGNASLQSALDKFERGDTHELEGLIQQGLFNKASSLDILDGLDLDFLTVDEENMSLANASFDLFEGEKLNLGNLNSGRRSRSGSIAMDYKALGREIFDRKGSEASITFSGAVQNAQSKGRRKGSSLEDFKPEDGMFEWHELSDNPPEGMEKDWQYFDSLAQSTGSNGNGRSSSANIMQSILSKEAQEVDMSMYNQVAAELSQKSSKAGPGSKAGPETNARSKSKLSKAVSPKGKDKDVKKDIKKEKLTGKALKEAREKEAKLAAAASKKDKANAKAKNGASGAKALGSQPLPVPMKAKKGGAGASSAGREAAARKMNSGSGSGNQGASTYSQQRQQQGPGSQSPLDKFRSAMNGTGTGTGTGTGKISNLMQHSPNYPKGGPGGHSQSPSNGSARSMSPGSHYQMMMKSGLNSSRFDRLAQNINTGGGMGHPGMGGMRMDPRMMNKGMVYPGMGMGGLVPVPFSFGEQGRGIGGYQGVPIGMAGPHPQMGPGPAFSIGSGAVGLENPSADGGNLPTLPIDENQARLRKAAGYVGAYSPEARKARLQAFFDKRHKRVWMKKVKYDVRKNFADSRLRVKGRFVKKEDEEMMRELLKI